MSETVETVEEVEEPTKLDARTLARGLVKAVVRHSVSAVAVTAVHTYVPAFDRKQKFQLYVGAYAMGGLVADSAAERMGRKFDEYTESVKEIRAKLKELNKTETSEKSDATPEA